MLPGGDGVGVDRADRVLGLGERSLIQPDRVGRPIGEPVRLGQLLPGRDRQRVHQAEYLLPDGQAPAVGADGLRIAPEVAVGAAQFAQALRGLRVGRAEHEIAVGRDPLAEQDRVREPVRGPQASAPGSPGT